MNDSLLRIFFMNGPKFRHALKKFKWPLRYEFLNLISFESGADTTKTIIAQCRFHHDLNPSYLLLSIELSIIGISMFDTES